ncbi:MULTISPECIES: hypothetical protein [Sinorhizobium]|uniref:hypothetical protein n=1 Tax=Sinorhizobium TaxID=28105 RepID=UPI000BE8C108|nr:MULTISPECIES: hypothetical protein [Sinorhizobium]PDT50920.1 hypothetical protein CO664_24540 [Sinorhizobium sp. NG07B]POH25038.1 hypothetical protein ATY30_28780 [Sinorhizobium americanum]
MNNKSNYRRTELIACALSKTFRNNDVAFTGLTTGSNAALYATGVPLAALGLAQKRHAPDLTILLAGWIHNPDFSLIDRLPDEEFAPALMDIPCEARTRDYPSQYSPKRQDVTVGFSSGAQIDCWGNLNSVQIGSEDIPKKRLVGPILQPEHMVLFGREIVMMPKHDRRTFVEKVDYVSGVGFPGGRAGRRNLGLETGGPVLVISPLCFFNFHPVTGRMTVQSLNPGVTDEELRDSTGFDVGDLSQVPVTPSPDEEDIHLLRSVVDPNNLLLRADDS